MRKMKTEETKIYEKKVGVGDNVYHTTTISASICEYDKNMIHIVGRNEYNMEDGSYISSTLNQIIIDKQALLKIVAMTKVKA
jgi:hypothetical protein